MSRLQRISVPLVVVGITASLSVAVQASAGAPYRRTISSSDGGRPAAAAPPGWVRGARTESSRPVTAGSSIVVRAGTTGRFSTGPGSSARRATRPDHSVRGASPARFELPSGSAAKLWGCDQVPDGLCGRLAVPLDRRHPSRATLSLFFELYPHLGPGPASTPVFISEGGPGFSVTQNGIGGFYATFLFAPLRNRHDLVMLDQRGVGLSGALDCPDAQHGVGDVYAQVASCGAQLGSSADLYGSEDVARDIDAVRHSLGYRKIDFYGGSNAAVDIQAFAARFRSHLHAAVLDSPVLARGHDTFFPFDPAQIQRTVRLICARSSTCSADHVNGGRDVAWLTARLRRHPLDGTARDAAGDVHQVHLTEAFLATHVGYSNSGIYTSLAELPAAARSLGHGDPAPLLRIGAENDFPIIGDSGDPTTFSAGENLARYCTDNTFHWNKADGVATRRAQFARAVAAVPEGTFAPWSTSAWLAPPFDGFQPDPCISWPAPRRPISPPVPSGAVFHGVPALVLAGDLDRQVAKPEARLVAAMFPKAKFVELRNSGHHTAVAEQYRCADALIQKFLSTLHTGETACARRNDSGVPAPGRFPPVTRRAVAATAAPGSAQASRLDRKAAAVTAATVTDGLRHAFQEGTDGVGLRGGTFTTTFTGDGVTLAFSRARLAADLAVSGDATLTFGDESVLDATLTVRGARAGTLHIAGVWSGGGATVLTIEGRLGGRPVDVTVPAT